MVPGYACASGNGRKASEPWRFEIAPWVRTPARSQRPPVLRDVSLAPVLRDVSLAWLPVGI